MVLQNNVFIWGYFYGLEVPQTVGYVFGAIEIAIAICLFLGIFRSVTYGAALPVLGGFPAPFLLRHWDLGMFNQAKA